MRHLKRLYYKHSKQLISELQSVESIAATCDFWSDKKNKSYLCITGHYVVGNHLKSTVLAFNVFDERHTGENIAETIEYELRRLKIYEKINTITCDGASNMKKALSKLKPRRIQCVAHKLHLAICNGLCLWAKTPLQKPATTTTTATPIVSTNEDKLQGEGRLSSNDVLRKWNNSCS